MQEKRGMAYVQQCWEQFVFSQHQKGMESDVLTTGKWAVKSSWVVGVWFFASTYWLHWGRIGKGGPSHPTIPCNPPPPATVHWAGISGCSWQMDPLNKEQGVKKQKGFASVRETTDPAVPSIYNCLKNGGHQVMSHQVMSWFGGKWSAISLYSPILHTLWDHFPLLGNLQYP